MDPAIKQMNIALLRYFHAERRGALALALIGSLALALAVWFQFGEHPLRAARWPLALIGLLQLAVGTTVFLRTEGQVRRLLSLLNTDPITYREAERPRMAAVMRNFLVLRWVELAVAASGLVLVTLGSRWAPGCVGTGWGLLVQGVVTLAVDASAEIRAGDYRQTIEGNLNSLVR